MKIQIQTPKYRPAPAFSLPDRCWPDTPITRSPRWCSVDLRDGNQALSSPMDPDTKLRFFQVLTAMGFKEIEIGFPAASRDEFAFTRMLIEGNHIPEDVTVQVLTQAREDLIRRTFEALEGVDRAIVHLYNATSPVQREVVFGRTKDEIYGLAVQGARWARAARDRTGAGEIRFEYSPESFTATEPDYALEICHGVMEVWEPSPTVPVILNLPATVETFTPNVYADRIEWFARNLRNREGVILSVHPHNDRGTGVAAAELAVMAGADRVEGTLFGNGERTGNVDIVTLALNLYSQGVDPGLDFSDVNRIRNFYRACTGMDVHPRHPYVGDLVYTAFSGSHQDAINKGMKAWKTRGGPWNVPYLPIDPEDLGRAYESIIRINSQSGKGGVAWIMENTFGFTLPKAMHPEFGAVIQRLSDAGGGELPADRIRQAFEKEYLRPRAPFALESCTMETGTDSNGAGGERTRLSAQVWVAGKPCDVQGSGNGPVDAFVNGLKNSLGLSVHVTSYAEHALSQGASSKAVAYVGIKGKADRELFGVGIDEHIGVAAIRAVLSAVNRRRATEEAPVVPPTQS